MNGTFSISERLRCERREELQNGLRTDSSSFADQMNGFTLMELLIVISIILILMLVAIPTAGKIRKHANELSAQKSLQTIFQAESMYESTYPASGFACSLQALGGDPNAGPPSPTAAGVINGELVTGVKSGYIFNITNCSKVNINNGDRITAYTVTAVPATPGKTGDRGFCMDSGGDLKADPAGGTNCTQIVQ
jgi:type IV pilus assembly protein PilA